MTCPSFALRRAGLEASTAAGRGAAHTEQSLRPGGPVLAQSTKWSSCTLTYVEASQLTREKLVFPCHAFACGRLIGLQP